MLEFKTRKIQILLPILCFISSAFCPALGWAEDGVAPLHKIGVVNLEKVFHDYERTKAADSEMDKVSNTKQSERDRMVSEIKSFREELVLLNEDSRVQRQGEMEQKLKGLATFDRQAKDLLRKQWDGSVKSILEDVEGVVSAYAKEHGFELILSERAVLYGVETIDVTNEILKILNERYTKRRP